MKSGYRRAYWDFLGTLARRYWNNPAKMWMGSMLLLSAHHFLVYARQVADELERECAAARETVDTATMPEAMPAV